MVLVPVQTNVVDDTVAVGVEQGARYVLTGPDGTRAVFNDRTDTAFVGFLTAPPSGLDAAEVRESSDLLVEADGGIHGAFYLGRRPFALEGIIDPTPGALDYAEVLTPLATNLVANPSAEVNVAGWVASSTAGATTPASLAQIADGTFGEGPFAFRITGTNAADTTARNFIAATAAGTAGIPVLPTTTYSLSVDVRLVAGALAAGYVSWYDAAGAILSAGQINTNTRTGTGTDTLTLTGPSPVGAAYAQIVVYAQVSTASATVDFRFDLVTFTATAAPQRFTGATSPSGIEQRTAWTGTAHASTSTLYAVTRRTLEAGEVANRRINRLQRASRALRADSRLEWQPSTAPAVRVTGRRAQPLRVTGRLPKTFSLSMVADDPRIYGQAVKTAAGTISATAFNVVNAGNSATPATVTVRGALGSPLLITNGGRTVRLNITLVANDVLVVDLAAGLVTLNGANRYDAVDFAQTAFWELDPGTNSVTVSAASGTATYEVAWRDAWT